MIKLKELRLNKGIDQKTLGEILNIGKGTISNWEVGRTEPGIEYLIKIANYFQVSLDELLGREDYATGNIVVQGTTLSKFDERLLDVIHLLSPEDQYQVLGFAQALAK